MFNPAISTAGVGDSACRDDSLAVRLLDDFYPFQPQLAPVTRYCPRTIEPTPGIFCATNDSFKDDARLFHMQHLARSLRQ